MNGKAVVSDVHSYSPAGESPKISLTALRDKLQAQVPSRTPHEIFEHLSSIRKGLFKPGKARRWPIGVRHIIDRVEKDNNTLIETCTSNYFKHNYFLEH